MHSHYFVCVCIVPLCARVCTCMCVCVRKSKGVFSIQIDAKCARLLSNVYL